jgi:hypothetical protein
MAINANASAGGKMAESGPAGLKVETTMRWWKSVQGYVIIEKGQFSGQQT